MIQPSEWLPVVWSDSQRSVSPAFADNEQAERILSLVLRLQNSIVRTLMDSPTRFKPLLYRPEEGETRQRGQKAAKKDAGPPEASAWCEGYMSGVLLREELWEPIYASKPASSPIGRSAAPSGARRDTRAGSACTDAVGLRSESQREQRDG
jgi:yecA family protein